MQVERLQAELLAVQASTADSQLVQAEAQAAQQALYAATEHSSRLQLELEAVKKELETASSASPEKNASCAQHQLTGLMNTARDIVGSIAQTLGQPKPAALTRSSLSGTQMSVGDVISIMNSACTVANVARLAWDTERQALEDRTVHAVATGAMNAAQHANSERVAMKEELMKLQGQIALLEQREVALTAAQDKAKVQLP